MVQVIDEMVDLVLELLDLNIREKPSAKVIDCLRKVKIHLLDSDGLFISLARRAQPLLYSVFER